MQNIDQFKTEADSIQWHIEHRFSSEMAKKSDIVCYHT